MSSNSILAAFGSGECVDPDGEVQLLAELSCVAEQTCQRLQEALCSQPCQVEWQGNDPAFSLYVLGDLGANQEELLAALISFLDHHPHDLRLVETRLVQRRQEARARHGFRFVSSGSRGPQEIVLAPGNHAFGTGNHPSTNLVVELLEGLAPLPSPVLDVGCGTGVLSLVAARLGARQVVGVDIDQEAVQVAAENARANDLAGQLSFSSASLAEVAGPFALIVANLTASVLHRLLATITSKAGPGCRLIVSGLQGRQGEEAEQLAAAQGWHLEQGRSLGKWQARLFVMNSANTSLSDQS